MCGHLIVLDVMPATAATRHLSSVRSMNNINLCKNTQLQVTMYISAEDTWFKLLPL